MSLQAYVVTKRAVDNATQIAQLDAIATSIRHSYPHDLDAQRLLDEIERKRALMLRL